MTNEPDLYPPDIEVLTPAVREARNRAMAGTFLVTMGVGLMLERTLSNDLDTFWLAVGLALVVGWTRAPRFPMFAVGSIMTGFGAASFVESLISIPFDETIANLIIAAGFAAVYVRYPHRARWALIPAGICLLVAVATAGIAFIGLIPSAITTLMLPLLLVAGGILLLTRNALPPRTVRIGLIAIAVMFVASAMSTAGDWDEHDMVFSGPPASRNQMSTVVRDIADRTLVVSTDSGAVEVGPSEDGEIHAEANARHLRGPGIVIDTTDTEATLSVDRPDASWRIEVPEGADLRINTGSGLVRVTVSGGDVEIDTDSGAVIATVEGSAGSLKATTGSGLITLNGRGQDFDIEADTGSGKVVVGDERVDSHFDRNGDGPELDLRSGSGMIVMNLDAAA